MNNKYADDYLENLTVERAQKIAAYLMANGYDFEVRCNTSGVVITASRKALEECRSIWDTPVKAVAA